jgi:competence protein ComGC
MEIKDYSIDSNDLENIKNIKIGWSPSLEEKIDYIYKTMKYERRMKTFKWVIKLLIFLWILYLLFIYIPSLPKEKIESYQEKVSNFMKERVTKFITPMVKDMTEDMLKDMNINWMNNTSTWSNSSNNLETELLRKMEILKKMNLEK